MLMTENLIESAALLFSAAALAFTAYSHYWPTRTSTATNPSSKARQRAQAVSAIANANRAYISLYSSCQSKRLEWHEYALVTPSAALLESEIAKIARLEREAGNRLRAVKYPSVDENMAEVELTKRAQDAEEAVLAIERLSDLLQGPPADAVLAQGV